ncbi:MAG: hypothetical protein GC131_09195 [Alphaproteobacteria bacterium]|nr:hypothetical protein [Alphaproteobacteria bacterium]
MDFRFSHMMQTARTQGGENDAPYTGWGCSRIAEELGITGIEIPARGALVRGIAFDIRSHAVNEHELLSLEALLNWAAATRKKDGAALRRTFAHVFGVADVSALPAARYEEAVRYLVDGPVIQ